MGSRLLSGRAATLMLCGALIPVVAVSAPETAGAADPPTLEDDQATFLAANAIESTEHFDTPFVYPADQHVVTIDDVNYDSTDPNDPYWVVGTPWEQFLRCPDTCQLYRGFRDGPDDVVDIEMTFGTNQMVTAIGFDMMSISPPVDFVVEESDGTVTTFRPDRPSTGNPYVGFSSVIGIVRLTVHESDETGRISNYWIDNVSRSAIFDVGGGVYCAGRLASIVGTDGDDVLVGTDGTDVIAALGGDDTVNGAAGDDVVCGGGGNDELRGMDGDDELFGDGDDDRIFGGDGGDVGVGGSGDDKVFGGDGDDVLQGLDGDDLLFGHADDDELDGGHGADRLAGGDGDDVLSGGADRDRLLGDAGEDVLHGGPSHDFLHGGDDNDELLGDDGNDYLDGAGGRLDRLAGGDGADILRDAHGAAAATGGGADDIIRITIPGGWVNPDGAPLMDEISGGYGNDLVEITLGAGVIVDITGDERDDPPSPREGTTDELRLRGEAPAAGSSSIKFEVGDTLDTQGLLRWNSLGSRLEIEASNVGPSGTIFGSGISFVPGVSSNGFTTVSGPSGLAGPGT